MVKDWTDDQIWALTRGGHDPIKVYAAYKAAADHKGQPTVILAKTVKGYGMGAAGEGPDDRPSGRRRSASDALKAFRDRFGIPLTDEQLTKVPFLKLPAGRPGGEISARAPRRARRRRCRRAGASAEPLEIPPLSAFDAPAAGDRRGSRDLDHDGVRAHPDDAVARQEHRSAHRADRARREPHLRHGGPVPPDRHLQPGRPALPAAGRRPADVLSRGPEGADPAGGHQRARRDGLVHRRGHVLFDVQLRR